MPRETKRPQQADTATEQSSELPELTPKQLGFVQGVLKGMTATDAYKAAYDCQNQPVEQIWRDASILRSSPKVSQWLHQAAQLNVMECKVTLENHVAELDRLSRLAETAGAYGASIKAQELRGRANGLYVDRIKTETDSDLAGAIKTIAKQDQGLALKLARLLGLPDSDIGALDNLPGDAEKPLTH